MHCFAAIEVVTRPEFMTPQLMPLVGRRGNREQLHRKGGGRPWTPGGDWSGALYCCSSTDVSINCGEWRVGMPLEKCFSHSSWFLHLAIINKVLGLIFNFGEWLYSNFWTVENCTQYALSEWICGTFNPLTTNDFNWSQQILNLWCHFWQCH